MVIKAMRCLYNAYNVASFTRLLNEAQGSLLDDVHLVNTLQTSKETSKDVGEQLQTAELTEAKIDTAREVGYLLSISLSYWLCFTTLTPLVIVLSSSFFLSYYCQFSFC